MRHGKGVLICTVNTPEGIKQVSSYEGDWAMDKKHGWGVYKYANGDKYEGKGMISFSIFGGGVVNLRVLGPWIFNNKSGVGTYVFANEDCYEGTFFNNFMHGKGNSFLRVDRFSIQTVWFQERSSLPMEIC